jgi:hypothetical protein
LGRGQVALDRVLRISSQGYNQSHAVARSSIALVKEYLRRVAEWAELSGQLSGLGPRDVLRVDLAGLLLPELVPAQDLTAKLVGVQLHGIAAQVFANFVRWEAAAEHRLLIESGLWEPYEPLIRLFERGGELFTHHGFIHVEHCACFMPHELLSGYAALAPFLDLRAWALDKLDHAEPKFTPDGGGIT